MQLRIPGQLCGTGEFGQYNNEGWQNSKPKWFENVSEEHEREHQAN